MKPNILLTLFTICLTGIAGCGENAPAKVNPTVKKIKQATDSTEKNEDVLSPDEFSQSFKKPSYHNQQTTTGKLPEKEKLPYKINSLEKCPFANNDFQEQKPPAKSSATKLRQDKNYFWLPRWHFVGKGEVYLPGADISEDRSLLAILETVPGGPEKKQGTMIILINTYNWNISRIH